MTPNNIVLQTSDVYSHHYRDFPWKKMGVDAEIHIMQRESLIWKSPSGCTSWRSGSHIEEGRGKIVGVRENGGPRKDAAWPINQQQFTWDHWDGKRKRRACMGLNQILCVLFCMLASFSCGSYNHEGGLFLTLSLLLGLFPSCWVALSLCSVMAFGCFSLFLLLSSFTVISWAPVLF